ncbi:hypothetical protein GRI41_10450 [Altererythrobacter aquaemixtae]|uniref:Uncharacterized protein n=2 Tax=Pontixanthobacter aquaemixtae TaxID=1958940 RepID=A0A844ZTP9_9SPHN|nr:hypothetical protein [Pontixanthobacter aquaemixtae]
MDQAVFNQLLQLGGSIVAILVLAWLAGKLGLGGDERIRDEAHARQLADESVSGFDPVDIAIDKAGYGALLRDADGRILVLKRHGTFFAGRLIEQRPDARLDRELLTIQADDKPFGAVTLNLGAQAQIWAASLRRLKARDA